MTEGLLRVNEQLDKENHGLNSSLDSALEKNRELREDNKRLRDLVQKLVSNCLYAQPAPTATKSCKFCFATWEKPEKETHEDFCPIEIARAVFWEDTP